MAEAEGSSSISSMLSLSELYSAIFVLVKLYQTHFRANKKEEIRKYSIVLQLLPWRFSCVARRLLSSQNCHVFRDSTNVLRDLGDLRRMCAFFHIPIFSISLTPFTFSFKLQISRFLPADIIFGRFCNLKKSLYMFVTWVELWVKGWLLCFSLDLLFQSCRFKKLPVYITVYHIVYGTMGYVTRRLRNLWLEVKLRLVYLALLCH